MLVSPTVFLPSRSSISVATPVKGLLHGGIAEGRITTEKYFDGKVEANPDIVEFIGDAIAKKRVPQAA